MSAAGAGAIALLHLKLFVVPQNALTKSNFWDPQFLPHHGVGTQVAFVWDGLRGFVTGTFTGSDMPYLPELLSPRWSWIPSVVFGVLLCLGLAVAARSERGRTLRVAIGGSIGLTLIASYLRYWPFGFVRTNFYLVPLLILLAGIGAVSATSFLVKRIGVLRQRAVTGSARTVIAVALVVLLALVMTGVGLAATYEVGSYQQLRDSGSPNGYGYAIGAAVVSMKHQAKPGAALVVAGNMAIPGWEYYQYEYSGHATRGGHQIGTANAEFALNHGSPAITSLVRRTSPRQVFLNTPLGTSPADIARYIAAVVAGAPCTVVGQTSFTSSGLLILMTCSQRLGTSREAVPVVTMSLGGSARPGSVVAGRATPSGGRRRRGTPAARRRTGTNPPARRGARRAPPPPGSCRARRRPARRRPRRGARS